MTRARSLGSHRLRRCTDLLYIPSSACLVDNRHVVSLGKLRHTLTDLARKHPVNSHRDVACRATARNGDVRDRTENDCAVESVKRSPRCEETIQRRLVATRVRLEECRQLTR